MDLASDLRISVDQGDGKFPFYIILHPIFYMKYIFIQLHIYIYIIFVYFHLKK